MIDKWTKDNSVVKDNCRQNDLTVVNRKVNMIDMQGIFFLLLLGELKKNCLQSIFTYFYFNFFFSNNGDNWNE